jgi:nucleotide-binding universal stress UspA family protein
MKNIVAAIDLSDVSGRVVEQAAALARAFSAQLWLLHVAAPEPDFVGYGAGPQTQRDAVAHELRDEHRDLQERAEALAASGVDAQALMVQGATVETILAECARLEADVVVLGSHGHGAMRRALMGSVSEGVLHKAACPVLIVR